MSDTQGQGIDQAVKTSLIALVIPILIALFDLSIKSRSVAIQRDGKLLMGLEDIIAGKANVRQHILPERFFQGRRITFWTSMNRLLESLAQFLLSVVAIAGSCYIYYEAASGDGVASDHNPLLFLLSGVLVLVYVIFIARLLFVLFKPPINHILTELKKEK